MNWYIGVLKKYAVFSGRARRKEYWMFLLFHIIIIFALSIIEGIVGSNPVLTILYMLAVLLPGLAVTVRRLHDTGKSGWWLLIGIVPLIGIVILVFMVQDSQAGDNQYGPNPKAAAATA
ncbi:MAG: DUF805 domain-containing protein [Acidobacteria bacterium]|nr:DUF805 domain-containing protein [Acidobacteriota bacterium]MCZ6491481.1 DUF805 domain-containing protein [Acidobacteriota bacterium]MCZ6752572.1 DUF805 domain-containing protein [Acidobacteriota bacterium]